MAWPTDLVRTKNWGTEVLTDSDLEGQFDLIIDWLMAFANETTGHSHDATENEGPKIDIATSLKVTSQAQGDVIYASSATAWARLAPGTSGQFLKTQGAAANPIWATVTEGAAFSGWFKKLKVTRPSATTVTVTADEIIISGNLKSSLSVTPDITASGANGLDTGAEANSTWYYIWIIRKSSDGTVAGLLSTSTSAPTMPSGYDQKTLVSAVFNDSGGNFINFTQQDKFYWYAAHRTLASGNPGTGAWTSITTTTFIANGISTLAFGYSGKITMNLGVTNDSTVDNTVSAIDRNKYMEVNAAGLSQTFWIFDVLTANTLYWQSDSASNALYIAGFVLNLI